MNNCAILDKPKLYYCIVEKSNEIGFSMPSDLSVGSLLKTLISSKPCGTFLELGTGTGLSLCWMIDGMDENSSLITLDNDPELIEIAKGYYGMDSRVKIICAAGETWITNYHGPKFDLIFADAWPEKYSEN